MKRQRIDNVLSGQARDWRSRLYRTGLGALEPVYRTIAGIRNRLYDRRLDRVARVGVPVVSIGNLTTGGTGKTPLVRWTVGHLLRCGESPAIVSRGYGSRDGQPNDEYRELELFLPETPHVQHPDRVAAAGKAIETRRVSSIVLDDGFQHRRIHRDLDIVLIDATCPFGYDHLLPRGLLREPVGSLARADVVVITRVDQVSAARVKQIRTRIEEFVPAGRTASVSFRPGDWIDGQGNPVGHFDPARPLVGFCGIGNPAAFRQTLTRLCPGFRELVPFADHHDYGASDLAPLYRKAIEANSPALVCTVKDLVKVRRLAAGPLPVVALSIDVQFESGREMLEQRLQQVTRQSKKP